MFRKRCAQVIVDKFTCTRRLTVMFSGSVDVISYLVQRVGREYRPFATGRNQPATQIFPDTDLPDCFQTNLAQV